MAVVDKNKFLPQGKKGGTLTVRPKATLAPIKKQSSSLAKVGGKQEDPMLVIKTKVIKIEDLLKGTLAAEKKAADEKRKQQEEEDRSKQEEEVESPKSKEKGIKIPVPGKIKSFWDNIKKFIGTVIFGWLALKLLPLLPKLMPIVKFLASTVDFLINIGGTILKGLVTFVDWGYKAVEATEKWIGDKFGEGAAEKFNSFTGLLTKTMNLVIALGIAAAAMSGRGPRVPRGGPRRGIRNRLRRTRTRIRRFTNPNTKALERAKNLKKIRADRLRRVDRFGKLKKFAKAKQFVKGAWGGIRGFGSNIIQKGKGAWTWADDFAKKQMANADNIIGGIKAQGAKWGKSIGGALDSMNPMKLGEKVKGLLKGKMDKIVKNNDLIKQIKNLNVKDAAKNIKKLLEGAKRNKNILKLRQGLKAAKAAKIGGVDAVIAAIMGVLDYAVFKESPINAILRALGGLLGYTAGFAIGAPFGGAPGFITGMAGAFVGEWASKKIAQGLAKTKLGTIQDPIMNDGRMLVRDPNDTGMNEELEKTQLEHGLGDDKNTITSQKRVSGRFDMETGKAYINDKEVSADEYNKFINLSEKEQISQYGQGTANNIVSTNNSLSNKVDGVSSSASYEEGSGKEVVIINPKNNSSTTPSSTEDGKVVTIDTGTGGSSDSTASLYRG